MKFRWIRHRSNYRFGFIPSEQQQIFLNGSKKFNFLSDFYFRLLGVPDVTQHVRFHYVSKLLNVKPEYAVIDIGCGYGLFSAWLASKGVQVIGVDITSDKIRFAKKTAKILGFRSRASFVVASACNLPFKEKYFKVSLCLDVIEHIPNDVDALSEVSRTLKPEGILILTTPCIPVKFRSRNMLYKQWGHVREGYLFEDLKKIIKDCGMEIVASIFWIRFFTNKVFDFYFSFFWKQHSKVRLMLCALLFPLMYTICLFDDIFFRENQGNEFALKIVKVTNS